MARQSSKSMYVKMQGLSDLIGELENDHDESAIDIQEKKKANSLSPNKVRMPERKFEKIESLGIGPELNIGKVKKAAGKVSPKNPGFRALRINVTKDEARIRSSTASISAVLSKPETVLDVNVTGPLTAKDELSLQ